MIGSKEQLVCPLRRAFLGEIPGDLAENSFLSRPFVSGAYRRQTIGAATRYSPSREGMSSIALSIFLRTASIDSSGRLVSEDEVRPPTLRGTSEIGTRLADCELRVMRSVVSEMRSVVPIDTAGSGSAVTGGGAGVSAGASKTTEQGRSSWTLGSPGFRSAVLSMASISETVEARWT